jgi:hypothetical protein
MEEYLMAVNPALWTIVNMGITFPSGDATLTQDQANEIQRNYQAIHIIKSSLTSEEYDKVDGLKSAKEVWDTLFINHEGTKQQPVRLAGGWCWFVLREKYCWLVVGGWFVLREKHCWLVADKPNEQGASKRRKNSSFGK